MKSLIGLAIVIGAGLLTFTTRPAHALKTEMRVTPQNVKDVEGLTVDAERRTDGRVRFTIRRDPAKARWHLRTGDLTVDGGGAGAVVECAVQGRKVRGGVVEYRFTVAADALEGSRFVLREVQGSEDDEVQVIGGGEFYDLRLADFAPRENRRG